MLTLSVVIDYSTRRVRRHVHGPDLKSVLEKQITIPVNVPFSLENYITSTLPQNHDDLPSHFFRSGPLIPVHRPDTYDPSRTGIPSLRDTAAETGNLRYWLITNESMWASQHPVLDEFAELMWALSHWFNQSASAGSVAGGSPLEDNTLACWQLARFFRRRNILLDVPTHNSTSQSDEGIAIKPGLPSLREMLLFRPWAFDDPVKPQREFTESAEAAHQLFGEGMVRYPIPDTLFWEPGDEGSWDEEGVPEWVDVPGS